MYIVYRVYNLITQKSYVGFTGRTLKHRRYYHYRFARSGKATYQHHFANALKLYKEEDWEWTEIDRAIECNDAKNLEIHYIEYYDSYNNGYNATKGGEGTFGNKLSDETRNKIALKATGRILSKETREKLSRISKGRKLSLEDKEKKSKAARKRSNNIQKGIRQQTPGRWSAYFYITRQKRISLGTFSSLEEAIEARRLAEQEFLETGTIISHKEKLKDVSL